MSRPTLEHRSVSAPGRSGPGRAFAGPRARRLGAIAVAAALVAALIVPMLVVVLAGAGADATDRPTTEEALGIASPAGSGAQRLLAGPRDAEPVAVPVATLLAEFVRPERAGSIPRAPSWCPVEPGAASSDAACAPESARRL